MKRQMGTANILGAKVAIIGSFIFLQMYTVNQTTVAIQLAMFQTLRTEESEERVLSLTLKQGSNVKHLIKSAQADALNVATRAAISKEQVSSWEISQLRTALNIGENPLPLDVAVKISDCPATKQPQSGSHGQMALL